MTRSLLETDGYKFSMGESGWPLRTETFHYAHRKGGVHVLPLDVAAFVRGLLPSPSGDDYAYLDRNEYSMGIGYRAAIARTDALRIAALPKGAVFFDREPVFSVTGPSALVSWLEPLVLQMHFRIQVATLALTDPGALAAELETVTCAEQKRIAEETLAEVEVKAPPMRVDAEGYRGRVQEMGRRLIAATGSPDRIFEVGMRAASCAEQHEIALTALRDVGVRRTSNVFLAHKLGMVPIGTMGHEHVQRYGADDAAFRAMKERRPYRSSYLLDTFDTFKSGIPAAYDLICEEPDRKDSIRYDSGDKVGQYLFATSRAKELGIRPIQILEDGFDEAMTRQFEELRGQVGWKPEEQFYGYGGTLVAKTAGGTLARDRVAAVWKLSQTGRRATMKFGDEAGRGKESLPGVPVLLRREKSLEGIAAQAGEEVPGCRLETGGEAWSREQTRAFLARARTAEIPARPRPSPATAKLAVALAEDAQRHLAELAGKPKL